LAETGYAEGKNVAIEHRWAGSEYERFRFFAADLVDRRVTIIFAGGGGAAASAAKAARRAIEGAGLRVKSYGPSRRPRAAARNARDRMVEHRHAGGARKPSAT